MGGGASTEPIEIAFGVCQYLSKLYLDRLVSFKYLRTEVEESIKKKFFMTLTTLACATALQVIKSQGS